MHPIAARYLLYAILEQTAARAREANEDCFGLELDLISTADYDISGKNPGLPIEAILGKRMNRKQMRQVLEVYEDASGRTAANLTAYLSAQLRANVYETLQKRLEKLCDLYKRFFNVLESSTEDLRRQIRELKTMGRQSSVGEQYICCSESCLEALYERFALMCQNTGSELPQESARMILRNIYGEMELELKKNNMEDRRREDMAYNNRMRTIFNKAVAEVMQQKTREQASSVVEISIYDAFALEMQTCLLYTSPSPRDRQKSRMPSSA